MKTHALIAIIVASLLIGSLATYFILRESAASATTSTTTQTSSRTLTTTFFQTQSSASTLTATTFANTPATTSTQTTTSTDTVTTTSATTVALALSTNFPVMSGFSFNENRALGYLISLNTTVGLLRDYQNDSHIFLADDQALDYYALTDIRASGGNASALQLANQINKTMSQDYGGLFQYWNPVFTLFGQYPSSKVWNVTTGYTQNFPNNNGYSIESTIFPTNASHPIEIKQYADIALYDAIWNIQVSNISGSGGNLTEANGVFDSVQTECLNYGCQDAGYFAPAVPATVVFSSYKVALDLIAYKELLAAGTFNATNMPKVNETINRLLYVANVLQAPDGGVYTQYNAYGDNIVPFGLGSSSSENAETTSLFTLAYYLWNNGHLT